MDTPPFQVIGQLLGILTECWQSAVWSAFLLNFLTVDHIAVFHPAVVADDHLIGAAKHRVILLVL